MMAGLADRSATTITSLGPAGISMAGPGVRQLAYRFAAVTQIFPGPKIFATLGTVSVPKVIAAMACAPPSV